MKKYFGLLLIVVLFFSCSSSDDSSNQEPEIGLTDSFIYSYENDDVVINSWTAQRSEDTFAVIGSAANGIAFSILFNKHGNLANASSYSVSDFNFPFSTSFAIFKSNFFNFELVGTDELNKRVEVIFSGDVYEESYDLTSPKHYVSGSFNLPYTDVTPQISGLGTYAKINNNDWYVTDGYQEGGFFSGSDIELVNFSDDEYVIGIKTNQDNTVTGEHDFSVNSTVNKILFYKYDVSTGELIEYETSGTLNLIEKNINFQITQIVGSFNFTAVNPSTNETINISDGTFNEVYSSY